MTGRERVKRCLRFETPDRVPREAWALPGVMADTPEVFEAVVQRFPPDFAAPRAQYGNGDRSAGTRCAVGTYRDEWGSVWHVGESGVIGEVKEPALADWSALSTFQPPWEVLERADFRDVNPSCAETALFVKAGSQVRPFERMQFLRGTENLYLDLAYGTREVHLLRDMVHEYMMRDLELWCRTDVDGISFMDDWGTQYALLIHPEMWRSFFKPLYKDYIDLMHQHGKFVFFHSDGHIMALYPELIELGVDAVNSQLFCMDVEEIGRQYKGRITFWGEIDRQKILPFGSPAEVKEAVYRVRRALEDASGGVIAQFEIGKDVPIENALAAFEAWEQPCPSATGTT